MTATQADRLVIRDVTVIDGTGAAAQPHRDVRIEGERITMIAPTAEAHSDATVIAGGGRFLIPGLWETQAHLARYANGIPTEQDVDWSRDGDFEILDANTRAYLRNGFTSVVDLGGPEEVRDLKGACRKWRPTWAPDPVRRSAVCPAGRPSAFRGPADGLASCGGRRRAATSAGA